MSPEEEKGKTESDKGVQKNESSPKKMRIREIYENYKLFDRNAMLFPAKDFIFYQADVRSGLIDAQRLGVIKALAEGSATTVVLTVTALMNHMMPFGQWKEAVCTVQVGDELILEEWKTRLIQLGYERMPQAENPGQFALRGGILDLFPMTGETGVRIELWGDEVDSIRSYDPQTQRSLENLESIRIFPAYFAFSRAISSRYAALASIVMPQGSRWL